MNKETNNKNDELLLQTLADALGPRPLTDDRFCVSWKRQMRENLMIRRAKELLMVQLA